MQKQTEAIKNYKKLRNWVHSSLDQFKPELQPLLLPIFFHTYIGLVKECTNPKSGNQKFPAGLCEEIFDNIEQRDGFDFKYFNNKNINNELKNDFNLRPTHLNISIYDLPQIFYNVFNEFQNPLINTPLTFDSLENNVKVQEFIANRFVVNTKRHAFALFLSFLERKNFKDILNLVNERIEINLNSTPLVSRTIDNRKLQLSNNLFSESAEKIYAKQHENEAMKLLERKNKERIVSEFTTKLSYSQIMYELMNIDDFCNRNEETFNVLAYDLNSINGIDISTSYVSDCGKFLCAGFDTGKILCFISEELYEYGVLKDIPNSSELIENKQQQNSEKNKFKFKSFELIGHSSPIISIDVFPGMQNIVSGSFDGSVRVWSVPLKRCIGIYNAHKFPIYSVSCMKQGLYFAVAGKMGFTVLYNLLSTTPLRIFVPPTPLTEPTESLISISLIPQVSPLGDNTCTIFHPNGAYIFCASNKVLMYDVNDGGLIREYIINSKESSSKSKQVPDLYEYVTSMSISHCGHFLAIGTNIGGVFLFNLEDNILKSHWFFNDETIYSIAFTLKNNLAVGGRIFYSICLNTEKVNRYGIKGCTGMKIGFGYRNIITVFAVKS